MRVAIVGGGASGLAAAWSLDPIHDVVVFEREGVLGGHIRTLGANVPCGSIDRDLRIDAGVIEFDRTNFTAFHAFMLALGIEPQDLDGGGASSLFRADGRVLHSPYARAREHSNPAGRAVDFFQVLPAMLRLRRFRHEAERFDEESLASLPVEAFLDDGDFGTWIRSLLMYAYSMSYEQVRDVSASVAVPMLREFVNPNRWTRIPNGVYSYVARIEQALRGDIRLNARIRTIHREPKGVRIVSEDGKNEAFDAVVLAVPPHRVLALLADPSDIERSVFGSFGGGTATTVVHTDTSFYERRDVHYFTEFDLFELPSGRHGYNAYLNRLVGIPSDRPPHYSLAFEMESEIDPRTILHRQTHDVAYYSVESIRRRADLIARNGERSTYYAGAFLGDGLHEGAIRSGFAVGSMLGGRLV